MHNGGAHELALIQVESFKLIFNLGSTLTRVGIACDFPAEFTECFARRPAFAGRCLLQADADVFQYFLFSWFAGIRCRAPVALVGASTRL